MTISSRAVQTVLPRPTSTLSGESREQFRSRQGSGWSPRQYHQPMRICPVASRIAMRNDDIAPFIQQDHGSSVNLGLYYSKYEELNQGSRGWLGFDPYVTPSYRLEWYILKCAELNRLVELAKEWGGVISEYNARLELLSKYGIEDGIELNESSKRDFYSFIELTRYRRIASLVLLDNGNVRAVWMLSDHDQIGIQFRGEGEASYVILKGNPAGDVSHLFGLKPLRDVRTEIQEMGFEEELRK